MAQDYELMGEMRVMVSSVVVDDLDDKARKQLINHSSPRIQA